ncbi:MAG: hypothetical protein HY903_21340 [Deltaproteobacteria bacterium]|nr:hypothetical protein [Deltaproteobacteria bacterium]
MKIYGALFLGAAAITHLTHRELDRLPRPEPPSLRQTLPSEEAVKLLALGYGALAADYYWLKAVYEFGDPAYTAAGYPNLQALVRRVLTLDPYNLTAYQFAGTALTVSELDPMTSIELLWPGLERRPDAWQVPFLLGFNLYYFAHDYPVAARVLARAALIPGAPASAGPLATRLAAQAGEPEIGLRLVDTMLSTVKDEKVRELYVERRRLLQLESEIKWLNEAVRKYVEARGVRPQSLEELKAAGIITTVPSDPLGGQYGIGADGSITTTSESSRLRLPSRNAAKTKAQP